MNDYFTYEKAIASVAYRALRVAAFFAVYLGVGEWTGSHGAAMAAVCAVFLVVEGRR